MVTNKNMNFMQKPTHKAYIEFKCIILCVSTQKVIHTSSATELALWE